MSQLSANEHLNYCGAVCLCSNIFFLANTNHLELVLSVRSIRQAQFVATNCVMSGVERIQGRDVYSCLQSNLLLLCYGGAVSCSVDLRDRRVRNDGLWKVMCMYLQTST